MCSIPLLKTEQKRKANSMQFSPRVFFDVKRKQHCEYIDYGRKYSSRGKKMSNVMMVKRCDDKPFWWYHFKQFTYKIIDVFDFAYNKRLSIAVIAYDSVKTNQKTHQLHAVLVKQENNYDPPMTITGLKIWCQTRKTGHSYKLCYNKVQTPLFDPSPRSALFKIRTCGRPPKFLTNCLFLPLYGT